MHTTLGNRTYARFDILGVTSGLTLCPDGVRRHFVATGPDVNGVIPARVKITERGAKHSKSARKPRNFVAVGQVRVTPSGSFKFSEGPSGTRYFGRFV